MLVECTPSIGRSLGLLVFVLVSAVSLSAQVDELEKTEPVSPEEELDISVEELDQAADLQESRSRLSDRAIPIQVQAIPTRPKPIIEFGDPFLGTGPISQGGDIGTGAVWNPTFQVFGNFRTAVQAFETGDEFELEWANRLDIFANLGFTATERILVGFRPIDADGSDFLGYQFISNEGEGWQGDVDGKLTTLFFEGDFGEIFPGLDPDDSGILDFGFAVGRQNLLIQDGLLINDNVDGVGITRNSLKPWGLSNLQLTFFYAWNELDRSNRKRDNGADLFALFTQADWEDTSLSLDLAYIEAPEDSGDAFFFGLSATQRFGHLNSTLRFLGSVPDEDTEFSREGYLLFVEFSWTPSGTDDLYYINAYWGIDEFSSALRSPDSGGPLARTGILYTAQGLGRFPSALNSNPAESLGLALGRQFFFDDYRKQLIVEAGARIDTDGRDEAAAALGLRYQQAFGEHFIFQVNLHGAIQENDGPAYGLRCELQVKF